MNRIKIRTTTRAHRATFRAFVAALALLTFTSLVHAQSYAITDLGTLGGTNCFAHGINDHEQIVGASQTEMGTYHAFMFDAGRMMDAGTMGGTNSWAYGVNDDGWMVGASEMPMGNMHGFLWTNTAVNPVMMDLGTLGGTNSTAQMINMYGEMVGWAAATNGSRHAFFMTNTLPGKMMDLGTAGGTDSEAYCINSNRMVVGYSVMSTGRMAPIMSTNATMGASSMMSMGMGSMGATGGQSWFVNDMGTVAGQATMPNGHDHAIATGSGGMMGGMNVDLGTLGGSNSVAYCINNANTVVGMSQIANGMAHAFMLTNALGSAVHMMDLNNMIPTNSGWEMMEARSINSSGQIVGWGMHEGRSNSFLLTPVSTPVMMISPPATQVVGPGDSANLHMEMSTSEPLSYQWLHDGTAIPGATNVTLTLPSMNMGSTGRYSVMARNAVGTVANASAVVSMFSMMLANGTERLTVAAPSGSHFRIEFADTLGSDAIWQTMIDFTVTDATGQTTDAGSPTAHVRFFRAVLLP